MALPEGEGSMSTPLVVQASRFRQLREKLRSHFPEVDDQTLQDTLEGLTDLADMLAAVLRSQLEDLALARGLRGRIAEMQERLARLEGRAQKKRQLACSAMERAELCKLVEPDFTALLRRALPALRVVAETDIPSEFWKPQPPKLDRTALTRALRAGVFVPGAVLDRSGTTLVVRTR
jgi:hypothetical protein